MQKTLLPLVAAALLLASPVHAGNSLDPVGSTTPMKGWVDYCERENWDCVLNPEEGRAFIMTDEVMSYLLAVNTEVNRTIHPMSDIAQFGVEEHWTLPHSGYGDCEDYQLLKRLMLVKAGFPRRALLMTTVLDELNEGHAVLMVRTDRGDFILDNKTDEVSLWHQTPYTYLKRESQDGSGWVSLGAAGPA